MAGTRYKGIAQYLIVGSEEVVEDVENLSNRLHKIGFMKGEISKNENLQSALHTLYRRMFPQQDFTDQEKKHFPNLKPLFSKYIYSEFEVLIVFIKSYYSGHPCRILTQELHPKFALRIDSNILWLMKNDNNLQKIVKLFFIDASTYPPETNKAQAEPPLLQFMLPPQIGRIFIGFVTKNNNEEADSSTKFFTKIVEELEKGKCHDFQEMFQTVRQKLEIEQIYVDCLDKL